MPDLDQRTVAEQAHVTRPAALRIIFVRGGIGDIDSYADGARGYAGCGTGGGGSFSGQ